MSALIISNQQSWTPISLTTIQARNVSESLQEKGIVVHKRGIICFTHNCTYLNSGSWYRGWHHKGCYEKVLPVAGDYWSSLESLFWARDFIRIWAPILNPGSNILALYAWNLDIPYSLMKSFLTLWGQIKSASGLSSKHVFLVVISFKWMADG